MDAFEPSKPDRLHQSLSNAWASFLGAQQCTREIGSLKRAFDEHSRKTDISIASLERDVAAKNELLSAAISDTKFKIEQQATNLKDAGVSQAQLSALRMALEQNKEDTMKKICDLSEKVTAQGNCLDGLQTSTSHDLNAVQEQYRSTHKDVSSLQKELEEVQADKVALEERVAALETQVEALIRSNREMPDDNTRLLEDTPPLEEEPRTLLDPRQHENIALGSVLPSSQRVIRHSQTSPAPNGIIGEVSPRWTTADAHQTVGGNNLSSTLTRRTNEERTHKPLERLRPNRDAIQDIRSLYLDFRERYKINPPKSDTAFIWQFIGSIEDTEMSKYIQDSLVAMLPDHVTPCTDKRRRHARKHVTISKGLTWRRFREALVNIPDPSRDLL